MNKSVCTIIGIDCAVDPKKRGVAVGSFDGSSCSIQLSAARTDAEIAALVFQASEQNSRTLLAIDAPLGWPTALGCTLNSHMAGQPIPTDTNSLFRRITDQFIKEKTGKQPLDVGADRIARTAHAALSILAEINHDVPLVWESGFSGVGAIEVYPAATLKSYGLPDTGYKDKKQRLVREKILEGLSKLDVLPDNTGPMLDNADTLDAVVCVLAGLDFLQGNCHQPSEDQQKSAHKEGWIWVKRNE